MAEMVELEQSRTSDKSTTQGKECVLGKFITEAEGWKIVEIARSWEGTPYSLIGAASVKKVGGDCSGSTNKIFIEAGFPYPYQSTANFAAFARKTNRFRKIDKTKTPLQAGDVLLWPGHMAIYAPFPEGDPRRDTGVVKRGARMANNMYTAFNSRRNVPYGPYNIETFRGDAYEVYRYLVVPGMESCP
ncbi:hypothetical protein [Massilia sp. METH4]|uniref:hypothetical protein n=1 Tax=Massilia sp. METH4 TaxID=3123041 RepID=UPI0030CDB086